MPRKNIQQYGERIRVRGIVQGVGFRPTVWRLAHDCGLVGEVLNDARGVLIHVWGRQAAVERFIQRLEIEAPPLSRIDAIKRSRLGASLSPLTHFSIAPSRGGAARTGVLPDAATCPSCSGEILNEHDRRYFYPFTNCTHCGPRLSIIHAVPYDRSSTSMAAFEMCGNCRAEYDDPRDRRFHAQPNACPDCGPKIWLEDADGRVISNADASGVIERACELIKQGAIVAIKGIGGIHLACDAKNETAVTNLRSRKHRYQKAFALMARDIAMVRDYCQVNEEEARRLTGREAPIAILRAHAATDLAGQIAPGQNSFGFMLPYTPLHHLLMQTLNTPMVLTSGNRSDEPQCITNADARSRLHGIADYYLLHDREIVNRLDDSVLRVMAGQARLLRRARGYVPASIKLPEGFAKAPDMIAMGGELKNTFCLVKDGQAVVSQHMGDLENAAAFQDYLRNIALYRQLFEHDPELIVIDKHPEYLSSKRGRDWADGDGLLLDQVQHHYAHVAACMAEKGLPVDTAPVLGIVMDGLGYGDDGTIWGGEFLQADYQDCKRLAHIDPVPMPGGARAIREPWRNTYAHLRRAFGWQSYRAEYGKLELTRFLQDKPLPDLDTMLERNINCPPASSCGRLFDAVAAALGICRDAVSYEGQAAMELQALAEACDRENDTVEGYPLFGLASGTDKPVLEWRSLWRSLLEDIASGTSRAVIARRFHLGLADAIARMAGILCEQHKLSTVILSGGVFQNKLLLEQVMTLLMLKQLTVLVPEKLPVNDGGLSFGQAAIAAARLIRSKRIENSHRRTRSSPMGETT